MTPKTPSTPRIVSLTCGIGVAIPLFVLSFAPPAQAGMLSNIRRSISSLWGQKAGKQHEARAARQQAVSVDEKADALHDRLEDTQRLLLAATANYSNYFRQMRRTEAQLVETRHRVQLATARYAAHKKQFARRLAAMQRYGQPTYLQVVFGSQTLSDLTRRTAIYETLTESDARLQAQIKADRTELEQSQNALMSEWNERNRLQRAANYERVRVANAERAQSQDLRQLNSSRQQLLAYAAVQEQSSREISSMIGDLESRRAEIIADYEAQAARERAARYRVRRTAPRYARRMAVGHSGRARYAPRVSLASTGFGSAPQLAPMPLEALSPSYTPAPGGSEGWLMPARGRLSSRFGMRFHPILHREKLHTGDDIAASYGSPITAARSGRVLWAGWKKAYGNTVIVDIGGGMTTLYGHASKLGVRPGQPIKAGEYLGNVGSTGWSTGPHLHFEVRRGGKPIDPTSYLRHR